MNQTTKLKHAFADLPHVNPPGHAFAKFCWMLLKHPDDLPGAAGESPRFSLSAPDVERVLRSAMEAGTTTSPAWASELSAYTSLTREWIDAVTRLSVIGKLNAIRVPFRTRTIVETGAFSAGWVAEGEPIPFSRATLGATATLPEMKIGVLVPFTDELFASWSPAVLGNMRNSIERAVLYAMDFCLLDPSITATDSRPASLTFGITPTQSTGSSDAQAAADLAAMLQALVDGGSDLSRVLIVMAPSSALYLSRLLTTAGTYAFPEMNATGGSIWGIPVAVATAAAQPGSPSSNFVVAIDAGKVLVADDGLILADASTASALQFDDAPSSAPTSMVALFQTGTRALRLMRYLNYERASDSACAWFPAQY